MRRYKSLPPVELLRELFEIKGGSLVWKVKPSRNVKVGSIAGCKGSHGYFKVKIQDRIYAAHRIAWAMSHGKDPGPMEIDHIDRNRSNNDPLNLRLVTTQQNAWNRKLHCTNRSGHRGVHWVPAEARWKASARWLGERVHLGSYREKADAIAARQAWEVEHWQR